MSLGQIGKYERLDVLGHGASGIVYLAKDTLLGKLVALKQISAQGEERERVLEEARVLDRLRHRNIVQVNGVDQIGGKIVIDMEYVRGRNLQDILRETPKLPLAEAVSIAIQICEGLAYAHSQRTVHRDVKPANILVSTQGEVKLVDFGLAEVLGTNSFAGGAGTYAYMAPEDFHAEELSDRQSDIWAVGVILYEMLSGVRPFRAAKVKDPFSWKRAIEEDPITPLSTIRGDVSLEIDHILAHALARPKDERYHDATAMASDLREIGIDAKSAETGIGTLAEFSVRIVESNSEMQVPSEQATRHPHDANEEPTVANLPPSGESVYLAGFPELNDIDDFLKRAPDSWEAARDALTGGALALRLRRLGEEPLAAVAEEIAANTAMDADEKLRDFLYRSGLETTDEAEARYGEGVRAFDSGRFAESISDLRAAANLDPSQPHHFQYLARALRAQGDHDSAVAVFEEALAHHPNDRGLRREYTELAGKSVKLTTDSVDFGVLRAGDEKSAKVVLRNTGNGVLQGRVLAAPDWIHVEPAEFTTRRQQPLTLTVDAGRVWNTPSSYDEAIVLETSGGRHQIQVLLTVLPRRLGLAGTWFWYLPLLACLFAPILAGLFAPKIALAAGLVATGLLAGSAFVVTITADTVWSLRWPTIALIPFCLAAAGGLLNHPGPNARGMALIETTVPIIALLIAHVLALWRSPKRWGKWTIWAALDCVAGIAIAWALAHIR